MTTFNTAVWYTGKLLREYILKALITEKTFFTVFFFSWGGILYEIINVNYIYHGNDFMINISEIITL